MDANFLELRTGEVRRIPLLGTWVNKGKMRKGQGILWGVSALSLLTFIAGEAVRRRCEAYVR